MTSVAFLRAINVGGTSIIKMAELVKAFEGMGFTNVKTYIQSGNVVFDTPQHVLPLPRGAVERAERERLRGLLETKIAKGVEATFDAKPEIMVRTLDELKNVVCANPFPDAKLGDNTKLSLYVAFLKSKPTKGQARLLDSFENEHEQFILAGKEIYCLIRKDVGKVGVYTQGTFEKKLGIPMTIRNYLTIVKMFDWHTTSTPQNAQPL